MKFLFRADASIHIGSGHIMRCLTLANLFKKQGHEIRFITRAHVGHLANWIEKQGFECVLLPEIAPQNISGSLKHAAWLGTTQTQDFADCLPYIIDFSPDWVICDHYALDATWQKNVQGACGAKIAVIDDLHDRVHQADVLIDQNLGHCAKHYANLLPENCRVLAGTRYALLRPEFAKWREKCAVKQHFSGSTQNVLLNLGGVDKDNITLKILQSLDKNLSGSLNLTVVMGASAPHIDSVRTFAEKMPFPCQVIVQAENMAELMAQADWAIGAAGSTSWERCCMGLPSILLILAENQRTIAEQLQSLGAAYAFDVAQIDSPEWLLCLRHFRQPENWQQMAAIAQNFCDGKGARRVVNQLIDISQQNDLIHIRPAQADDVRRVFAWRNHADIRRFMFQQDELIWENHAAWFARQLDNSDFKMLIYIVNHYPQGYISFKKIPNQSDIWEWGFYTAPDCPRGHGTRMGRLALAWAFAELGVRGVRGAVLAHNGASLRLHEKLGFFRLPENDGVVEFELLADNDLY